MIFRIVTHFRILYLMPPFPHRTMLPDNIWNVEIAITTLKGRIGRGEEHQENLPDKFLHNFNEFYQQFCPGL